MATQNYTLPGDIKLLVELTLLQARQLKRSLYRPIVTQIHRLLGQANALNSAKTCLQKTTGGGIWTRFKRSRAIAELTARVEHCREELASWVTKCLRYFLSQLA